MYLIAGLGNPSLRYKHTRHNAGFDALDFLAKEHRIPVKKQKYLGLYGEGNIGGEKVGLLKPQTFMNKSGESILSALKSNNLSAETDLIVLVDDISLECGMIRIRTRGSAGGHNGLKDIEALCGTQNYTRIRIGVGKLHENADMIKHVLSRPKSEDAKRLKATYPWVAEAIVLLLAGETEKAMNLYNGRQQS